MVIVSVMNVSDATCMSAVSGIRNDTVKVVYALTNNLKQGFILLNKALFLLLARYVPNVAKEEL